MKISIRQNIFYVDLDVDDTQYYGSAFNKDTGEVVDFKCRPTLKGNSSSDLLGRLPAVREVKTFDIQRNAEQTSFMVPGGMCALDDSSFDLIVACDVLKHVIGDSLALEEMFRVLSPEGWAILTVPQKYGLAETYEDKSISTEAERLEAFGQEDHLRIYGDNFPEIIEFHNFVVVTLDGQNFKDEIVQKNILFPPRLSSNFLATNYRKAIFAQKPLIDF